MMFLTIFNILTILIVVGYIIYSKYNQNDNNNIYTKHDYNKYKYNIKYNGVEYCNEFNCPEAMAKEISFVLHFEKQEQINKTVKNRKMN